MGLCMAENKHFGFEEQLSRLAQITESLEGGELTLEKSLELYKEGVVLARNCRKILDKAGHTAKIYAEDGFRDFSVEGDETGA